MRDPISMASSVAALQDAIVADAFGRVAASPFYRDKLARAGIVASDIQSRADLMRLPFTTKDDLRAAYPLNMLAVPRDEVVRIHASSGTTGKPTVTAYTAADIALWSELCARILTAVGVTPGVVVHDAYGYGLFTGGLAFHYAAERLGALVIPASNVAQPLQVRLMRDLGARVLLCTPSMAVSLAEAAHADGVDPRTLGLTAGVFGGEPWSDALRAHIERLWGIDAYDTYGLSEVIGPGVAHECREKDGLHLYEDHFIAEIIDPESGVVLPDGAFGELVITALTKRAQPLIRYRTGDRTALTRAPCRCGSPFARLRKVVGRSDDRFAIGARVLFPSQVEAALLSLPGVAPHYQITLATDVLVVRFEPAPGAPSTATSSATISATLSERLGCRCHVERVAPGSLPRSTGKAQRVTTSPQQQGATQP